MRLASTYSEVLSDDGLIRLFGQNSDFSTLVPCANILGAPTPTADKVKLMISTALFDIWLG